jgi:hypothetical protein
MPDNHGGEMSNGNDEVAAAPTVVEIADLERLAAGIIRAQGNRFIKELFRSSNITVGATKDELEANVKAMIAAGDLRLGDVDAWLREVEGWGNQHVYLYRISSTLLRQLTVPQVRQSAVDARVDHLWDAPTVLAFPDKRELTSISFNDSVLRLVWQEASPGWTRVEEKDIHKQEGLDTYEFRAWRMVERRAVTRFEAQLDLGLAGLFIPNPIQGDEHRLVIAEAKRVIAQLMNLSLLERNQLDISVVSRNMDQRKVPDRLTANPKVKTQRSRLSAKADYVEFAANSKDIPYWEEDAIHGVGRSVRDLQLAEFQGTGGVYVFQPGSGPDDLDRALLVQLYGSDDRIKLWAQMTAREVWTILSELSGYA